MASGSLDSLKVTSVDDDKVIPAAAAGVGDLGADSGRELSAGMRDLILSHCRIK